MRRQPDDRTRDIDALIRDVHGFGSSPDDDFFPSDEVEYIPALEDAEFRDRPFSPIEAQERDLRDRAEEKVPPSPSTGDEPLPVDIWARASSPPLPEGLLPPVIENFARLMGETMGADPAGLAMAGLATCAAALPDSIDIRPKEHDPYWLESARIWVALVGLPSTMKSPMIHAATRPLTAIDRRMYGEYVEAKSFYDALDKDERLAASAPSHTRVRLEDTTIEAAQEVLKDSPEGLLLLQDELSGWFGSMEKYSGSGRGSSKDRAFWLQSFNGGPYTVNRIGRGASMIPNLSISLLGGIQPEPIRAIAKDMHDDGLLQRLFPIVLRPGQLGKDVPMPDVAGTYGVLVDRLTQLRRPLRGGMEEAPVRFSASSQRIWHEVTAHNHELSKGWEAVNVKLAAHCGKFNGLFARLCLLWHCIESRGERPAVTIDEETSVRVRDFLYDFLYPHAIAFYTDVIGLSDRQDEMQNIAGWILTHKPDTFTLRDIFNNCRAVKSMDNVAVDAILQRLDAFGWITQIPTSRRDSKAWRVNFKVHDLFKQKAAEEEKRRTEVRRLLRDARKPA